MLISNVILREMVYDKDKHPELKSKARDRYDKLGEIYCRPLKAHVKFNADGYYHMLFKSNREKRTVTEQHSRLVLIPLIKPVLYKANKIHETRIDTVKIRSVSKTLTCFSFIEYVGENSDVKIKVVVRQTGTSGGYFFHSVMKMNRTSWKPKTLPEEGV